jgi:hypothetical protein
MITYSDIKDIEEAFKKPESIKVLKNICYVFTGIIVLYIIIVSI